MRGIVLKKDGIDQFEIDIEIHTEREDGRDGKEWKGRREKGLGGRERKQ